MNSFQTQKLLDILQEAIITKISEYKGLSDFGVGNKTEKKKIQDHFGTLETFVKNCIGQALAKSDFVNNKNSLLISCEKSLNSKEVKDRVDEIVGEENVAKIAELKSKNGRKSTFKVDFKPKIANDNEGNSKPTYTISKFYSGIKESNNNNTGNRIFGSNFVPKSALAQSSSLNKICKSMRENIPKEIKSSKIFTRIKVNQNTMSLDVMLKNEGQLKFSPIEDFNISGFQRKKWVNEIEKAKKENVVKYVHFKPKNFQNQ